MVEQPVGGRTEYVVVVSDHDTVKVVGAKDIREAQAAVGAKFGCLTVDARYFSGTIKRVCYA